MGRPVPGARRPGRLFGLVLAVVLAAGAGAVLAWPGTIISSTIIRGATTMAAQTPTVPKVPKLTGSRAHEVSQIENYIARAMGNGNTYGPGAQESYSDSYGLFAQENPDATALQAYEGWLLTSVGAQLPVTIADALSTGGAATEQIAAGTAAGADAIAQDVPASPWAALDGFLSNLESGSLWLRLGEAIAGIVLLGIAANAIFKGKPLQVITGAAGTIGKVVPK